MRPHSSSNFFHFFLFFSIFYSSRRSFLLVAPSSSSLLPPRCSFLHFSFPSESRYFIKFSLFLQILVISSNLTKALPTDRPTDQPTDKASFRDARMLSPRRSLLLVAPSSSSLFSPRRSFLLVAPFSSSLLPPRCSFLLVAPSYTVHFLQNLVISSNSRYSIKFSLFHQI